MIVNEKVFEDVKREYDYDEDPEPDEVYYVEKQSRIIYAVRFFDDLVLVRCASPELHRDIYKLNLIEFADKFDEFLGDQQSVKDFLWGDTDTITVTKDGRD